MRSSVKWGLTAALAALMAAPVLGQLASGDMMSLLQNGIDTPLLLSNKGVQKEIKMTPEQSDKVQKIVREVYDKYQADTRKARADRDQKQFAKLVLDSTTETRERVNKALPDILDRDQIKRVKQIQIQVNGLLSLNKPEIQKELNLTDAQKEQIKKIGDGLTMDLAEVFKDVSSAPLRKLPEATRKARTLRDEATRKAVDTLNDDQKKTWKEMTGEKFDFKLDLLS
jgi:Spy/CpxP family protein refolding chaperone